MDEFGAEYFRQREAEARQQADHASTRSIQILRLKSAEFFWGGLALDAEQNVVPLIRKQKKVLSIASGSAASNIRSK